ncbi:MAG: hypothetical protein CSB06_02065 [Bacteroidia bacterium]|nr:MAG: hypothetical protein CSB06_02065 [Bacteroidia bacterium]
MKKNTFYLLLTLFFLLLLVDTSAQTDFLHHRRYAKALFEQGKYAESLAYMKTKMQNQSENKEVLFLTGECLHAQKKYEQAISFFARAGKQKHKQANLMLARCYACMGRVQPAVEHLKLYLKNKDKLLRSELLLNPDFKNIEKDKKWTNLWKSKFYTSYEKKIQEAKHAIDLRKYAMAYALLDELLLKNANRHKALAMRAYLAEQTGDYKLAVRDFRQAASVRKKSFVYQWGLARNLARIKKYTKSLKVYESAVFRKTDEVAFMKDKAQTEFKAGKAERSEATVRDYLRYYPDDASGHHLLGKILANRGENMEALEQFGKALSEDSSVAYYFADRAEVYGNIEMYKNAVDDYSMALDLQPNKGEFYYKRGVIHLHIDKERACTDFKRAKSLAWHTADDFIVKYCQ